tara:strand:+ start:4460 stop:5602 length:1143 start_codon:yes stop_codon:yes gene_type:complete
MKILCLTTNRIYTNNTQQLFPLTILSIAEVTFYGPGYVSDSILDKGVEEFIKECNEDFDFILTDGMIFFWNESKGTKAFNISYNYFSFDNLERDIRNMRDFYISYKGGKILYPNIDFYNVTKEEVLLLEKSNTYLLTWGIELLEYKENLKDLKNEVFSDLVNDNWIKFIKQNTEKIISLPHIISETEFSFHPVNNRNYEITVPGVNYYSRKIINKIINSKNFKVNNRNASYYQKLNIFLLRKFTTRSNLKVFNQIFNNTIEDSKIAYTCGSGLDYLIRKFFEIPAKGTVLFCNPFKGFKEIGFVDGENCVVVNPNNIEEKTQSLLSNIKEMDRLSRNGQRMVFKNHSFIARVNQVEISLKSILKGEFKGSFWDNGNYKLR